MSGAAPEHVGVHGAAGEVLAGVGPWDGAGTTLLSCGMLAGQVGCGARGTGKSCLRHAGELNLGAGALGALKSNSGMGALGDWAPSCIGRGREVVNRSAGVRC